MEYIKPEILALGSAAAAIQGGKQEQEVQDSIDPLQLQSIAAYEADE
jgi:hypothetical protein